jgi:hypothetical protein
VKNLVVYVVEDPTQVGAGVERFLRLQVELSLEHGWAPDDLLLLTNFPFAHRGVAAREVHPPARPKTARITSFYKTWCILRVLDEIGDDESVWYHDADAFQMQPFAESPSTRPLAFTLYATRQRLLVQGGSLFFDRRARPVFEWVWQALTERGCRKDEFALTDAGSVAELQGSFELLDGSWNLGTTDFELRYQLAEKPIRVVHFHPERDRHRRVFVEARNGLGVDPLTPAFRRLLAAEGLAEQRLADADFAPTVEATPVVYRSTSPLARLLGR